MVLIHDAAGELSALDTKRHIPHRFEVPNEPGLGLEISFTYAPGKVGAVRNLLCLSLFGPAGFRGAGHRGGDSHRVTIAADHATPGYLAGRLEPGTWHVVIDAHAVLPGAPCRYRLRVELRAAPLASAAAPPARPEHADGAAGRGRRGEAHPARAEESVPAGRGGVARRPARRWYLGDLHAHTCHSDGQWDVATLVGEAERRGLDFVTLTDHNTVSGLGELAAQGGSLVTIPGMELTTFRGHALSLGVPAHVDWRDAGGGRAMSGIVAEIERGGALFVIAHPCAEGDPVCTGCDWRYPDVMPGPARAVEVWNGPWWGDSNNERALALYYSWLDEGFRLVATAGSDAHRTSDYRREIGFNAVWATAATPAAILRSVAAGRLCLTSGSRLLVRAHTAGGQRAGPGGTIRGGSCVLTAAWSDCPAGARARLIVDGACSAEQDAPSEGKRGWSLAASRRSWAVVELRGDDDRLLALANPVFFGGEGDPTVRSSSGDRPRAG